MQPNLNIEELGMTCPPNTTVVLLTKTEVKTNKKDVATKTIPNPYADTKIFKISGAIVRLNADYEAEVNQQRAEEGRLMNFKAGDATYGKFIGNSILQHEETLQKYLRAIYVGPANITTTYVDSAGEPIEYDKFAAFVPVLKPKSPGQNVSAPVQVRNYKLESIIGYMPYSE